MKIVINTCYGGFGLSHEAVLRYAALKNMNFVVEEKDSSFSKYEYYVDQVSDANHWHEGKISDRSDPALVQVVEELGEAANGWAAELKVVDIPDDVQWYIEEYDGNEWVAEKHRTWS